MARKTLTLPRHTNLASQGLRVTAAIADFAIWLALAAILYLFCFRFAVSSKTNEYGSKMNQYLYESHLFVKNEKDDIVVIDSDKTEDYQNAVEAYYLRYLANNPLDGEAVSPDSTYPINIDGKEVYPKDLFTVGYYNEHILNLDPSKDPEATKSESIFTFQKDENGEYLREEPAIRRSGKRYDSGTGLYKDITEDDFYGFYKNAYTDAYKDLIMRDFYKNIADLRYFYTTLALVSSGILSGIIFYVAVPWLMKNGQTLGKKIFKLGLATYDGYIFSNKQLLLRFVPFFVAMAVQLIPIIFSDMLYLIIFYSALLLVSFALMMASPKRAALHDFAARTIVIDLATSIIFENELMEEQYIAREDNLPIDENSEGEEPELKYER